MRNGGKPSRAELDEILKQHKLWLTSEMKSGARANLTSADLRGANLNGAILSSANLNGAILSGAYLENADLVDALLNGAILWNADLNDANLSEADLAGAVFQPRKLPELAGIAQARGLELMTYGDNPGPLTQLRKQFQDAGYREQERAITCALNRHNATPSGLRLFPAETWKFIRNRPFEEYKIIPFGSFVERSFKWIAFDLTCEYGFSPGRPLRIVGVLWLLFSIVYAVFMHRRGSPAFILSGHGCGAASRTLKAIQIRPRALPATKWWKIPFLWLRREWRVLRAAMFFSLMSAFNIGFRDINFGRWLRIADQA